MTTAKSTTPGRASPIACTAWIQPLKEAGIRRCGRNAVGERADGEPRCNGHMKNATRWTKPRAKSGPKPRAHQ